MPEPRETQRDRRLEFWSLALCGILGVAFAIVLPPLQLNDEHGHFIRAYAISGGEFVARGTPVLPPPVAAFVMRYPEQANLVHRLAPQEILHDLAAGAAPGPGARVELTNADGKHAYLAWSIAGSATYCPLVYLPASLGIGMARVLRLSPLAMMYAARIFGVLTLVSALAVSFRRAPGYRAVMAGVALIPMTLHEAGGISGDVMTIAVSFVGLSMVLHAREHLAGRRFLILSALVFTMWGLSKFSVWSLPLLLLIPVAAFRNRRTWLAYIGAVAVCVVGALAVWNAIDASNVEAFRAARLSHGIDVAANVRLAAAHPLMFTRQLLGLLGSSYWLEVGQFLGVFGWTMLALPPWVRLEYLLLLLVVAATEFSAKPFRGWERGVLLLVFLAGTIFVHAVIFISDGTLCAGDAARICFDSSAGVQGRYFLPICLAGLVALRQSWVTVSSSKLLGLVMGVGTLQALAALVLIWRAFYV